MATPVLLDCDTGTDDAVAIMLAALSPALELVAVTTVNGNVPVEIVTENTLRVLQYVGRPDVPVHQGAAHAIDRGDFPVPRHQLRGFEMHGTYLDLPPSVVHARSTDAVEALAREALAGADRGTPITIIATGPLTNIAECVRRHPEFVHAVERIVIMGGGHALGNVTPSAEFNFWADPEAAKEVLAAGFRDVLLVPLDATHLALVSGSDCAQLRALGTPAGTATAAVIEQRIDGHDASQPMAQLGTAPVHDAVCVAAVIRAQVISTVEVHVDVEVTGELTVGRSVIDLHRRSGRSPNARVAMSADAPAFVSVMLDVFAPPS
ncbi:pyrimidine-specific ribonucleoside hydrolase RihA [soil metagenome]